MAMKNPKNARLHLDDLITANPAMQRCLALAREGARSDLPILLQGETGTGKTLLAQAIHNSSHRVSGPFISFNASAMSDNLLESQLFGHEQGAFTGATSTARGKFEQADSGTLFFDEIADMSKLAQAKILRAVEYGEFEPLGAEAMREADVRVMSATNRPLRAMARDGDFRTDLYHRLNGLTLSIPPLRDRPEDLPGLIAVELQTSATHAGKQIRSIHPEAFDRLLRYSWPGNLRELHRVVQTVVLFTSGDVVLPSAVLLDDDVSEPNPMPMRLPRTDASVPIETTDADFSLDAAIIRHIEHVYALTQQNKRQTALRLGVSRSTLDRWLEKIRRHREGELTE